MASIISQKNMLKRHVIQKAGVAVVNNSHTGKRIMIKGSLRKRSVTNVARMLNTIL